MGGIVVVRPSYGSVTEGCVVAKGAETRRFAPVEHRPGAGSGDRSKMGRLLYVLNSVTRFFS